MDARKLLTSVTGVLGVKILGAALLFTSHILFARLMGVDEYGQYIYVWTWVTLLVLPARFGMTNNFVRHVAAYNTSKNRGKLKGILLFGTLAVAVAAIVVVGLSWMTLTVLSDNITSELMKLFHLAIWAIPLIAFLEAYTGVLCGDKRVVFSQVPVNIFRPILLMCFAITGWYINSHVSSKDLMEWSIISNALLLLLVGFVVYSRMQFTLRGVHSEFDSKVWLSAAIPLVILSGMQLLTKRIDIVMIGAMEDTSVAGIYSAASRISDLVLFGIVAIEGAIAPVISSLYSTGKIERIKTISTYSAIGGFIFALFIFTCGQLSITYRSELLQL